MRHTLRSSILLIILELASSMVLRAQLPPKREVRGVWITTATGLDWPRSKERSEQQSSLRSIILGLKEANFNTIFFQVRPRGDAYYKSAYEPWAENLTGTLGKDPGWDPLAFVIKEAHTLGMELHAWFNVYKIRGLNPISDSSTAHPSFRFPQWTVLYEGEQWLDPGVPEVRKYLTNVALDLVEHYPVDGIHFDFIRYPGQNFMDAESFGLYGHGTDRENWRRSNIDRFVADFYKKATSHKLMLKVGSTPLGIYNGFKNGDSQGGYFRVYQDSRGWLQKKIHDYLAPQVYWSLGSSPGNPDFTSLAKDWQTNSFGRQIIIGIGAYKPEVFKEIPEEIDAVRKGGGVGHAFYRYENIKQLNMFGGRYDTPANIPPMPWKDSIPPNHPTNLVVTAFGSEGYQLEWSHPKRARDGDNPRYYNIYRWNSPQIPFDNPRSILSITSTDANHFIDSTKSRDQPTWYYAVSAFDKGHNESSPSNIAASRRMLIPTEDIERR